MLSGVDEQRNQWPSERWQHMDRLLPHPQLKRNSCQVYFTSIKWRMAGGLNQLTRVPLSTADVSGLQLGGEFD